MKKEIENKPIKVEFISTYKGLTSQKDVHPYPTVKKYPAWYSKLSHSLSYEDFTKEIDDGPDSKLKWASTGSGTVRMCIPFRDYVSSGYTIPLWSDTFVQMSENSTEIYTHETITNQPIGIHKNWQVSTLFNYDHIKNTYAETVLKFLNPWIIKTPPGYSCLFLHPIYHFDESFFTLQAIVDTDTYHAPINFPFLYKKKFDVHKISKGTPIVHIIPFKRENFVISVSEMNEVTRQSEVDVQSKLNSLSERRYEKTIWSKEKARYK